MHIKERFRAWRNRTTIRKQLSIVVGAGMAAAMTLLTVFNYATQTRANTNRQIESMQRVLALESARLDDYVSELCAFSLQPRSSAEFLSTAAQSTALTYAGRQVIESALKNLLYAREDVTKLEIYLIRQNERYAIDRTRRKVTLSENVSPEELPDYASFISKPDFLSITSVEGGFLRITRTIIDSPRETPLAVIRFIVNQTATETLAHSHALAQERLCVFGTDGAAYLLPDGFEDAAALWASVQSGASSFTCAIDGKATLCVVTAGERFITVGLKSMAVVNAAQIATRNASIVLALIAVALSMLLMLGCIRFVTDPLSKLAHRLRRVGTGNFKTRAKLEGSTELIGLSEDVNHMMAGIDGLIESNYVAKLNERTAQLVALEAQTNPHFLFNTLQAISSEAIVCGQEQIYRMVTALAALLRYSVKGGNTAPLETELGYVEKYLMLQKARFGDRLVYTIVADDRLLPLPFPKLGLLSLVENSIVHGMRGDVQDVHITLSGRVENDLARFSVTDDGSGVDADKLTELRAQLDAPNVTITQNIGLVNLAARLKLLYDGRARLEIDSRTTPERQTTVTLTIPMEVLCNVQDADC